MISGSNAIDDTLTADEASFLRDFAASSGNHGLLPRDQPKGPDPDLSFGDVLMSLGGPFAAVPVAATLTPNLPLDPFAAISSRSPLPTPPAPSSAVPTWVIAVGLAVAAGAAAIFVMRNRR